MTNGAILAMVGGMNGTWMTGAIAAPAARRHASDAVRRWATTSRSMLTRVSAPSVRRRSLVLQTCSTSERSPP